jgi:hypothetical protein
VSYGSATGTGSAEGRSVDLATNPRDRSMGEFWFLAAEASWKKNRQIAIAHFEVRSALKTQGR